MKISSECMEWGIVIKLSGSLDLLSTKQIEAFFEDQSCGFHLGVDLSEVDFMDSTGLGALVQMVRRFERAGKRVILIHPAEGVSRILKMTSVDRIVPIAQNTHEAAAMLANATPA